MFKWGLRDLDLVYFEFWKEREWLGKYAKILRRPTYELLFLDLISK
jgi:hypothetical protein